MLETKGKILGLSDPSVAAEEVNGITRRSFLKGVGGAVIALALLSGVPSPAKAAYRWSRTLSEGMSGSDVKELQVRVAGWAADSPSQTYVALDGAFGPDTEAAVKRFQKAYGLAADGVVGPETQGALNRLEDSDGTKNFAFSEFYSKDGSGFSGGKVGSATVKENVRRNMWKLEALRKKAGDRPISIFSGFRSIKHNSAVDGAPNSQHMYGIVADLAVSGKTPSQVREIGKTCGFSGIKAYPSFTHLDNRIEHAYDSRSWWWV